jgi:hypothetical protein
MFLPSKVQIQTQHTKYQNFLNYPNPITTWYELQLIFRWTVVSGPLTMDYGPWTMDRGLFPVDH